MKESRGLGLRRHWDKICSTKTKKTQDEPHENISAQLKLIS